MKPISKTAFYCTGVRALDARKPKPICGDQYAERFMDDAAWQAFEPFKKFTGPNISNAMRHRIIDDLLRDRLALHPDLRIVIIGAGFDSRAFRLKGGRWLEIDEPQIFAWKDPRLPVAQCPNPLTRVTIDFESERLAGKLAPFADSGPVAIVVEGVLFYGRRGDRARATHRGRVHGGEHYRETQLISAALRAMNDMPLLMRIFVRFNTLFHTGYTIRVFEPTEP